MLSREKIAPLVGELLGVFVLTFVILSVSKSAIGIPYFVAIAAGLVLAMVVVAVGKLSGAHINPAVTVGMWSARQIGTLKALLYIAVQFMGAAFAWKLYTYFIDNSIPSIAGAEFDWRIFTAEAVGTMIFTFGVAAALYQKQDNSKFALTAGVSLIIGILIASSISNGVINPAVALGVQSWSREYVVGPLVGGIVGVNLYALLFAGERLAFNPGRLAEFRVKTPNKATKSKTSSKKSTKKKPASKKKKK